MFFSQRTTRPVYQPATPSTPAARLAARTRGTAGLSWERPKRIEAAISTMKPPTRERRARHWVIHVPRRQDTHQECSTHRGLKCGDRGQQKGEKAPRRTGPRIEREIERNEQAEGESRRQKVLVQISGETGESHCQKSRTTTGESEGQERVPARQRLWRHVPIMAQRNSVYLHRITQNFRRDALFVISLKASAAASIEAGSLDRGCVVGHSYREP